MQNGSKTFHIGDILSITKHALVSPRHMHGVYDILDFMTGEELFTHQLPRASDECEPSLLAQFPDLAAIDRPDFSAVPVPQKKAAVEEWLAGMVATFGETREVAPLAADDHTSIDPLDELRMIRPDAEIISVVVD